MLIDPRDGDIRYVGKTTNQLHIRLSAHMREVSNCHRVHWLNELKKLGLKPHIAIIEEIIGLWPWQESERFWIAYLKRNGFNLTNNTSGGDGVPDLPEDVKKRLRAIWPGKKHKPSTIEKLRNASTGKKHSLKTKQKMSIAHSGRIITWGDKLSEANRKISREEASNIKSRIDSGEHVTDLAIEYKMHRTSISKIKKGTYFEKYNKPSS